MISAIKRLFAKPAKQSKMQQTTESLHICLLGLYQELHPEGRLIIGRTLSSIVGYDVHGQALDHILGKMTQTQLLQTQKMYEQIANVTKH